MVVYKLLRLNVNPQLIQWIVSSPTAGQIQWTLYTLYHYQMYRYRKALRVLYYHQSCLLCIQMTAGVQTLICSLKYSDDTVILHLRGFQVPLVLLLPGGKAITKI